MPLVYSEDGTASVEDDFRIRSSLPTIEWLKSRGARVTVCSHLGRPEGKPDPRLTMEPVREVMGELKVDVDIMENLRFDPGEEANDPAFVDRLVAGQDLYVDDAFGAAHRAHASIVGPPARLPSAGGRLLVTEVEALRHLLEDPVRPFVAVVGGSKVSDKLSVLRSLLRHADVLIIGGAMAFSFLAALGHEVGDSLVEREHLDACRELLDSGRRVVVPTDVVALAPGGTVGQHGTGEVRRFGRTLPDGWKGLDIGPETSSEFASEITGAGTVLWNGPMGVFEDPRFEAGTRSLAEAVAACGGYTVAGGGDTSSALDRFGLAGRVDHLSTGGGATMELIERGDLPGLAALRSSPGAQGG